MDIATTTGLRKTGFSANLYGDDDGVPLKSITDSKIPRSPLPLRRKSIDNGSNGTESNTGHPIMSRKTPVYRSVRKPATAKESTVKGAGSKDINTWSGRTNKKRPTFGSDTFQAPPSSASPSFNRNSAIRASQTLYDKNGRRIVKSTTTSPTKTSTSPLAQQILEAAGTAKNDTQILEKMKTLLSRYTNGKSVDQVDKEFDDFTAAWVNSNGTLDRVINCGASPVKMQSKRSSAASSIDSCHSRDSSAVPSAVLSPRRDRGMSRIPAPIRQNTELY